MKEAPLSFRMLLVSLLASASPAARAQAQSRPEIVADVTGAIIQVAERKKLGVCPGTPVLRQAGDIACIKTGGRIELLLSIIDPVWVIAKDDLKDVPFAIETRRTTPCPLTHCYESALIYKSLVDYDAYTAGVWDSPARLTPDEVKQVLENVNKSLTLKQRSANLAAGVKATRF